jgi:hypothetical protein
MRAKPSQRKLLKVPSPKPVPKFRGTFRQATRYGKSVLLEPLPDTYHREIREMGDSMPREAMDYFPSSLREMVEHSERVGDELPSQQHANDAHIFETVLERAGRHVASGRLALMPRAMQYGPEKKGGNPEIKIWMPYAPEGRELTRYLESSPGADAKKAYGDLMRSLAYLHGGARIAHRDLRKKGKDHRSNILVWTGDKPHLTDFSDSADLRGKGGGFTKDAPEHIRRDLEDARLIFKGRLSEQEIERGLLSYRRRIRRLAGREFDRLGLK